MMTAAERAVARSAMAVFAGILVSGPIALIIVDAIHPQPDWQGAERFAAELHWIQVLPYLGGFLLVGGSVALVASLHALAPRTARSNLALALAAAFAAMIFVNYVLQTTFVPSLARPYRAEHDALIAALAMANPRSLAWALEMWGYAVYGVATWAIASAFGITRLERAVAAMFVANGVISVAGGFATMASMTWLRSPPGLAAFALWNALMLVMAASTVVAMRRRATARRA
jgi:hypothetical protein